MRPRDIIKDEHENAVIEQFVAWFNGRTGKEYRVVAKPEPPDALIEHQGEQKWLEHADIYRSPEEARDEYFSITPGEQSRLSTAQAPAAPEARTAESVYAIIQKKLAKASYSEVYDQHGSGILVLSERDPLFNESTLNEIYELLDGAEYKNDKGFFEAVYLGIRSLGKLVFFQLYPNLNGADQSH